MPAKSKAQQRAAGAALSAKRGETPKSKLKGASKEMADSMSEAEAKKLGFAPVWLGATPVNVLEALNATKAPSCTEATLRVLGLSFAGWNVLTSAALATVALWGVLRKKR